MRVGHEGEGGERGVSGEGSSLNINGAIVGPSGAASPLTGV